ncbi:MAG: hypothetical protein DDT34_00229 [Firmicutes bacterium]|nr:hypothetical protein [Bacillota bacterium]MBT9157894.1 hypothetical protein [Bacillota bacterium]
MVKGKKKKKVMPTVQKKQAPKIDMWVYMVGGAALGLLVWFLYRLVVGS